MTSRSFLILTVLGTLFFLDKAAFAAVQPDHSQAEQGLSDYAAGQYEKAVLDYQKAAQRQPGNAQAYYGQGVAWMKLADWARAEKAFQRSVELSPLDAKAWLGLGWALQKAGRFTEAAEAFQKVCQLPSTAGDQALARKRLAQLGVSPLPARAEAAAAQTPVPLNPESHLNLSAGAGLDDNLNRAPAVFHNPGGDGPLSDDFNSLSLGFGQKVPLGKDGSGLAFDAVYDRKNYFADTGYDNNDVTGKVSYALPFFSWLTGSADVSGEYFGQDTGIQYDALTARAGFKGKTGSFRLSAGYSFNAEQYSNYDLPYNPASTLLGDPGNVNSTVEVRAYETLLPWLVLNGAYRFEGENGNSPGYDSTSNGVGGGLEIFLFSGRRLLGGLQANYLYTSSQCPNELLLGYEESIIRAQPQNDVNIVSACLDVPLFNDIAFDAFYRYVNNQSNFPFFSYVENTAGFSLSCELL